MPSRLIKRARMPEQELARRLRKSNAGRLFGFELKAAEFGRATLRMRVGPRHIQVHGVVHGGIIAALADTAGGMASYTVVPRGTRIATIEMKINFLEAVDHGTVVAEARVIRHGRNFIVVDCDLHDSGHRLVAKALMTFGMGVIQGSGKSKQV